jgi:hypothetical protein
MKRLKWNHKTLLFTVISLVLLACLPVITSAQGRGRGQNKKVGKFVNGHDARDGRWDRRGPRGSRVGNVYSPRVRRLSQGHVILIPRNRGWRVDRDGDGDFDRNDRVLGRRHNRRVYLRRR